MYNQKKGGGFLETTLYADVLFLINFSMDFITVWLSAIISSRKRSPLRMTLSASIGGLYGVLCAYFSLGGVQSIVSAALISLLMCLAAFGTLGSALSFFKQSALIWGCGALLGGVMTALLSLSQSPYQETVGAGASGGMLSVIFALSTAAVYVGIRIFCSLKDRKTVFITATWRDRTATFTALCDSGNLMRDPISGDPVIPVSKEIASKLCTKAICSALLTFDTAVLCEQKVNMRLIPHRTDGKNDIIAGFIPDEVTVTYEKKKNPVRCILAPRNCSKDYYGGHGATVSPALLP